jgi:hypothetical protein
VAAALALASSGEDVAVDEADTLVLTLVPAEEVTGMEALGSGEAVRDAAPLASALLLELGVTLEVVLTELVGLELVLALALALVLAQPEALAPAW